MSDSSGHGCAIADGSSYGVAKYNSIMRELFDKAESNLDKADEMRIKLPQVVAPLVKQLKRWYAYLIDEFIQRNQQQSKRGTFIKNKVGKRLYLDELSLKGEARKAKSNWQPFYCEERLCN